MQAHASGWLAYQVDLPDDPDESEVIVFCPRCSSTGGYRGRRVRAERLDSEPMSETTRLVCVECGAEADEDAAGWRAFLTVDDEAAVYCPECAAREFGEGYGSKRRRGLRP